MNQQESVLQARQEMIRLLGIDEWRITDTARSDGIEYFRQNQPGTWARECAIIDYVHQQLVANIEMHDVPLGEPPGSRGIAFAMTNVDGQGLYIKLKIERDQVWVLSFKKSKHLKD